MDFGVVVIFFCCRMVLRGWCSRHAREDSLKEMVTEKERKDQRVFKYLEFIGFFTELLKAMSPDTS